MPMDFPMFIAQLNDALLAENGPNLAYLLRPTSPHGKDLVKEFRNPTVHALQRTKSHLDQIWLAARDIESV